MSRTKRVIKGGYHPQYIRSGGDAQVMERMGTRIKPYTRHRDNYKQKATKTERVGGFYKGVSKYDKLITRNANRSYKKALRQYLKKLLKDEVQAILGPSDKRTLSE